MKDDPAKHHQSSSRLRPAGRRSIRLKGHDYAGGGLYFLTLCAHREFVAAAGTQCFAPRRDMIAEEWRRCGEVRTGVFPGEFVVMPDHFHGLLRIEPGASELGKVVGAFKAAVSRRIRRESAEANGAAGGATCVSRDGATCVSRDGATCVSPVRRGDSQIAPSEMRIWHRNYYERIVRSDEAKRRITEYIRMNPWRCVQQFGKGLRGIGNPALWSGDKLGVLCSRNAPRIGRMPDADVYLGGWHSPKEREMLEWLLKQKRRVIACPAWGVEAMRIPDAWRSSLEGNRMLILEMNNAAGTLAAAEERNRFVIEHADELFVPYTTRGGMLDRLLVEAAKQERYNATS